MLAAAEGEPFTPVQIQKSLFLLGKNLPESVIGKDFYRFEPYDYGPFDRSVYTDASILALERLAGVSTQGPWRQYLATPKGIERAKQIEGSLSPEIAEYIRSLVSWVRCQSFSSLVQAIYRYYPEMKANSVFEG